MRDLNTIANRLIRLRGRKSQEEVANDIGISASTISMYEQGRRMARDEIKVRLANYYNVTVQELFLIKNYT